MPKGSSDIKRHERQEKRRVRNRAVRSTVKTFIGRARDGIRLAPDADETQAALGDAISQLDRAARKGVIHPNNAARRKSRLVKHAQAAAGAA